MLNALGRYEITPGVEIYAETYFAHTEANDQVSQAVWNTDFFGGSSAAIEFNVTNPFLRPEDRATIQANCSAAGLGDDPADCDFLLARSGLSLASGNNETKQNLYRVVTGLRGDFDVMGRNWAYDVSFNYGRTEANSSYEGISNRRFAFALDAVALDQGDIDALDAGEVLNIVRNGQVLLDTAQPSLMPGDIACQVELDRPDGPGADQNIEDESVGIDVDACVPLNYFGENNTSPEARAYVNIPFNASSEITQRIFEAYVTGDLFDLWAGPVSFAVGYQNRHEQAAFRPGGAYALGLGRSAAITPTAGSFTTNEIYGELSVPLIERDMDLFVSSLVAEGKFRYVDNNRAGGDLTYTAGGRAGFFDDSIVLRGNYTRSIRSPALVEQFLPVSTTFSRANDPCDSSNITAGANAANREANCRAEAQALGYGGIDTFQSTVINGTAQGTTGGNPDLANEAANAWTVGAIFTPTFVPRLALAVDYINIKIQDAITNLDLTSVMQACYDADPGSFPNDYCGRFSRAPGNDPNEPFQVLDGFRTGYANAGFLDFQGIQAQLNYNMDVARTFGAPTADYGTLRINGSLFHLLERQESVTGFDLNDDRGEIGSSKWRGQLNMTWDKGPVSLFWQTRYIGPAIFSTDDTPESRDILGIGSYWLFNVGFQVRATENMEFQFNVDNLFDKAQPYAAGASANNFVYDQVGRFFRATGRLRF